MASGLFRGRTPLESTRVQADLVGWASAIVLLATLSRQVYTQYRSESTDGVSKWLFAGQVVASIGFVVYSVLLRNWVFALTNTLILITALFGEAVFLRNRRRERRRQAASTSVASPS